MVVGLVVLAVLVFQPFLLALLWAGAIALVSHRAYEKLATWMKGRRNFAALVMTVAVLILILGPFFTLSVYFFEDTINVVQNVRAGGLRNAMEHPWVKWALSTAEQWTGKEVDPGFVKSLVAGKIEEIAAPLVKGAREAFLFMLRLLASLAFVGLSIFYLYRDGPDVVRVLRELLPMSEEDRDLIFNDIGNAVNAAVRGGLLTALVQGVLGLIIMFILGIEQPILWAAVMALTSFVPLVGTAIVWVPMAGFLALNGEVAKAIVLAGYGVVVIASSDNLLRPLLVGQHMHAHPLLLFFGILGGIALFGFAGIILGPVLVAFLGVSARLLRREFATAASPPSS